MGEEKPGPTSATTRVREGAGCPQVGSWGYKCLILYKWIRRPDLSFTEPFCPDTVSPALHVSGCHNSPPWGRHCCYPIHR